MLRIGSLKIKSTRKSRCMQKLKLILSENSTKSIIPTKTIRTQYFSRIPMRIRTIRDLHPRHLLIRSVEMQQVPVMITTISLWVNALSIGHISLIHLHVLVMQALQAFQVSYQVLILVSNQFAQQIKFQIMVYRVLSIITIISIIKTS